MPVISRNQHQNILNWGYVLNTAKLYNAFIQILYSSTVWKAELKIQKKKSCSLMPNRNLTNMSRRESDVLECHQTYNINSFEHLKPDYVKYVSDTVYQKNIAIEGIDILSRQICKKWILIQKSLDDNFNAGIEDLIAARQELNKCFQLISDCLVLCSQTQFSDKYINCVITEMKKCLPLVIPLTELDEHSITRLMKILPENCKCPIYNYFHSLLDFHYHNLILSNLCKKSSVEIEVQVQRIIKDLIHYNRSHYTYFGTSSKVFTCSCVQHFWLFLQLFTETYLASVESFWKQFNGVIKDEDPHFILWILKDLALLHITHQDSSNQSYVNFDLLETSLKHIVTDRNTDSLLSCLQYIDPLITDVWLKSSKIEIYQLMWDYFSKRMNSKTGSSVVYSGSAVQFSDLIDTILWCPKDCMDDFHLFIAFLVRHLKEHPHHWGKIKGRIYSQLNPHKVKDFNIDGIFNVMVFYFCLLSINHEELTKKILSVIEVLPEDKKHSQVIWNTQICYLLRQVKQDKSISGISKTMLILLKEASDDNKKFWLLKLFIDGFQQLIANSRSMQLHQWCLIDSWLCKYMLSCYYNDLKHTLNVVLDIVDRVKVPSIWIDWETSFKEHIYPLLKQLCNMPNPPVTVGRLSARISILSSVLLADSFSHFNSEHMSAKISSEYLCELLGDYPNNFILSSAQENLALQTWIKTCILTVGDYQKITRNMVKLDTFLQTISTKLILSEDPFVTFVEHLGSNSSEYSHSSTMIKLCETCFAQTDRWISQYFIQPDNEAVVMRVYSSLAVTFVNCGSLLYNRNKATCPLASLITSLLLPTEFMVGKSLHPFILTGIKNTWHLFTQALVRLNRIPDHYLDRTLRDLVVKYLPYFTSSDSPIIKCLDDEESANVILEKISANFFKHPTRESDSNVVKAFKLINEYVLSTTSSVTFTLIMQKCLYGIFEVIMFHNQRNTAISTIKNITSCSLYNNSKQYLREAIIIITEKHMAFNTVPYFQLMNFLVKFVRLDLLSVISRIEEHLSVVERMRGVGSDKVLRLHFDKLKNALQQS